MRSRAPPIAQPEIPKELRLHNHAQSPPTSCACNRWVAYPRLPQPFGCTLQPWRALAATLTCVCNPDVRQHNPDVQMQPCRAWAQPDRASAAASSLEISEIVRPFFRRLERIHAANWRLFSICLPRRSDSFRFR